MNLEKLIVQLILNSTSYITGLKTAGSQTQSSTGGMKSAFSSLGLSGVASFLSVGGAITGLILGLKACYTQTLKYGDSVRELSMLNGTSAEETSRLIQVTDDYKITVEDLEKATKVLAKEGLSLTNEQLAIMSDEYLALNTDAEKTAYLMKNFGAKGGTAFVELMRQGGDAIRAANDAVDDGLVLSQKQLDMQRENQKSLDKLNDAFTAIKISVGNFVIPLITKYTDLLGGSITTQQNMTREIFNTLEPLEKIWTVIKGIFGGPVWGWGLLIGIFKKQKEATDELATSNEKLVPTLEDIAAAEKELAEAEKILSDARQEHYNSVLSIGKSLTESDKEILEAEKELYEYTLAHPLDTQGIEDRTAAVEELKTKQKEMIDAWMLDIMTKMLLADGIMSEGDQKFLLDFAENTGQITANARKRADELIAEARRMTDGVNAETSKLINRNVYVDVITTYSSYYESEKGQPPSKPTTKPTTAPRYASGTEGWLTVPSGYLNDSYNVGLTSGEKYAVIPKGSNEELLEQIKTVVISNKIDETKLGRVIAHIMLTTERE